MRSSLMWGWRVTCAHPDCGKSLEHWDPVGTPSLSPNGYHTSGLWKGWFLQFVRSRPGVAEVYGPVHVALCPDHSHIGARWLAQVSCWETDWKKASKDVVKSVRAHLGEMFSMDKHKYDWAVRDARRAWELKNPKPVPPWRNEDD